VLCGLFLLLWVGVGFCFLFGGGGFICVSLGCEKTRFVCRRPEHAMGRDAAPPQHRVHRARHHPGLHGLQRLALRTEALPAVRLPELCAYGLLTFRRRVLYPFFLLSVFFFLFSYFFPAVAGTSCKSRPEVPRILVSVAALLRPAAWADVLVHSGLSTVDGSTRPVTVTATLGRSYRLARRLRWRAALPRPCHRVAGIISVPALPPTS